MTPTKFMLFYLLVIILLALTGVYLLTTCLKVISFAMFLASGILTMFLIEAIITIGKNRKWK